LQHGLSTLRRTRPVPTPCPVWRHFAKVLKYPFTSKAGVGAGAGMACCRRGLHLSWHTAYALEPFDAYSVVVSTGKHVSYD
jgi:hypothetical protein